MSSGPFALKERLVLADTQQRGSYSREQEIKVRLLGVQGHLRSPATLTTSNHPRRLESAYLIEVPRTTLSPKPALYSIVSCQRVRVTAVTGHPPTPARLLGCSWWPRRNAGTGGESPSKCGGFTGLRGQQSGSREAEEDRV